MMEEMRTTMDVRHDRGSLGRSEVEVKSAKFGSVVFLRQTRTVSQTLTQPSLRTLCSSMEEDFTPLDVINVKLMLICMLGGL